MNWDLEIDKLRDFVFVQKMSYEEIGRIYNCSGNNIKKILIKRGIELPIRSKNAGKPTYNKGTAIKCYCKNCGKDITHQMGGKKIYCSNKCQQEYIYKEWINKYKEDNTIAKNTRWGKIPSPLREYIFNKFNYKCCKCGWSEVNEFTNTIPLEIDHIDGNSENNSEDNLQLLCPNCHSLTSTYRGANRGFGRNITWILK